MRYFDNSPFKTNKIKDLFINSDIRNTNESDEYLSVVRDLGVIKYSERGNSGNKTSDTPEKYKMVDVGDLVINPMNVTIGSVGVSEYSGCLSGVYLVLKPRTGVNSKYYHYLFHDKGFQKYLKTISYGIMEIRESINKTEFFQFKIPKPSVDEKEEIVSYLDKKTTHIDELIKKIEQKIELFKEQRISLINELVTKGLNSNVEMKNSYIEWIGEIPSHWELLRLNNLGRFSKGKGITKDKIKVNGNKCIRCGEIYTTYELRFNKTKSFIDDDTSDESVLGSKGVLLFTGDGESLEEIGKCVVYEGEEELYIGGGINVFTPKQEKVIPIYLSYVMNSQSVIYQKYRQGRGEIVVHIYSKQLKEIRFGLPPIKEQQQIVEYLDEQTSLIDNVISNENQRLLFLKEYKQSLISEVVTGKKRVVG